MGVYSWVDKKFFRGKLPGGSPKQSVTITIPQKATQTTPSGEVVTAERTSSGTSVTSTTGQTKSVSVGGRRTSVSYSPPSAPSSPGSSAAQQAAAQAAAQQASQAAAAQRLRQLAATQKLQADAKNRNSKMTSGYEVIRNGQGYSTRTPQPGDSITNQPSRVQRIKNKYNEIEDKASDKLYKVTGFSKEKHEEQLATADASTQFLTEKNIDLYNSQGSGLFSKFGFITRQSLIAGGGLITGAVGNIAGATADNPISTPAKYVALTGAAYGLGLGLSGATALVGGTSSAFYGGAFGGGASSLVAPGLKLAGGALSGAYLYKKGQNFAAAPTISAKGGILGEAALETFSIGGGLIAGKQDAGKLGDIWRTRGRVESPVSTYVIPDVLSGKTRFVESKSYGYSGPTGPQKQAFDIKVFEGKDSAFHVTPDVFYKDTITAAKGSSEFPGLYTAPSSSVYFAKVGNNPYKISLFGSGPGSAGKPGVVEFQGLKFSTTQGEKAFVTGVKPEIEAVIPVGQQFSRVAGDTYFKFGGRRFPVDIFKPTGGAGEVVPGFKGTGSSSGSSYTTPQYSLINPVSVGASVISEVSPSLSFGRYSGTSTTTTPSTTSYLVPPQSSPSPSYVPPKSSGGSRGGGSSYVAPLPPVSSSPIAPPSSPGGSITSPTRPSYVPSSSKGNYYNFSSPKQRPIAIPKFKAPTLPKMRRNYGVQIRRQGKFFNVGNFGSMQKAFQRGQKLTSGSLAATFKLTGGAKLPKAPKGYYTKKKGDSFLYIEKSKYRLSKKSETSEIQAAKRKAPKKKKVSSVSRKRKKTSLPELF